ncbi:MAG: hypothetical protein ABEJ61_09745 [Haloferacaceae archaeon]
MPTTDVVGELTIRVDLSGGERTVVLPADVRVERDREDGVDGRDGPDRRPTAERVGEP